MTSVDRNVILSDYLRLSFRLSVLTYAPRDRLAEGLNKQTHTVDRVRGGGECKGPKSPHCYWILHGASHLNDFLE
jgi:hypothetical protein